MNNKITWQPNPDRVRRSAMHRFMGMQGLSDYHRLHDWSVQHPDEFWAELARFCDVRFSTAADSVLARPGELMHAGWFAGSTLNYADHLLSDRSSRPAIIAYTENGERRSLNFDELAAVVARVAAGLKQHGVGKGDRVAGYLPNCPEAVIAMLATTSLGAVWSSCSPDFGASAVVDRFGQIEPKVLFTADGYVYNGKRIDSLQTAVEIRDRIPSIEALVVIPFNGSDASDLPSDTVLLADFEASAAAPTFEPVAFDHPLFILFSSGTTGVPKCIVHGHGGTLLQHLKEHRLHTDLGSDDRLFYFTTCGWMMWNWLVSALASGTTIVLFDGSPFIDDGRRLWEIAERETLTVFGTSAKYLSALSKTDLRPGDEYQLGNLRSVLSTGSPLAPEGFDFVQDAIGSSVQVASIAGGTDIVSCFVLGNPLLPVRRGEIQCAGLGMDVQIFNERGERVFDENGELVCCTPFPSAPVGFWADENDDRYRAAYFERFERVWAHGDYAVACSSGGFVINGRSDSVLNPGGVRIGTAEIYRQVEQLDDILESLVIGQDWDGDVRVILFVRLRDGVALDDALHTRIRTTIRRNATPRHVPAKIVQVDDIPRTKSGKIVELAVRDVVHGREVANVEALANPEALALYRELPELAS
ncbi:MAG: acetoacetate--CoA ligase [Pseudomonadota bacterium]